jgi:hypothetical protein
MSYRCQLCQTHGPGKPLRHVVMRPRIVEVMEGLELVKRPDGHMEVHSETMVCKECDAALKDGQTLAQVRRLRGLQTRCPEPFLKEICEVNVTPAPKKVAT